VVTQKGHGFEPAELDPVYFHTPPPLDKTADQGAVKVPVRKAQDGNFTDHFSTAIGRQMETDPHLVVLTAAMCQGNKLESIRESFPERFFDTGICESHAVAFAAGMAKAGIRPVVDIYSTFLQRAFDQVFQEVSLQNLPVIFTMDRAGITGPDGPTHHGVFDIAYLRIFPNMVVMAPGDAYDIEPMLQFALQHDGPVSIRYPKARAARVERAQAPFTLGKAEIVRWGHDVMIFCFGAQLADCVQAANILAQDNYDVGVVNARFAKPLDRELLRRASRQCAAILTVEEGVSAGGFGSAVLEAASEMELDGARIHRLAVPDRYVEHGERAELLADLQLDACGIANHCRDLVERLDVADS
jgi:1-deoxy-D-xylulose-5-phosphate synthase